MNKWTNSLLRPYLQYRYGLIQRFCNRPHDVQQALLSYLLNASRHTLWGHRYHYASIRSARAFSNRVPIQDYNSLKPYIQRMMEGERDVLWKGRVGWFSKSSGTTSDKSKFIPVSDENLRKCHIKGSWDAMAILYHNHPHAMVFGAKNLVMGGSITPYGDTGSCIGDVSAIMIHKMPTIGRPFYTPDFETALMSNWEEKIERMAHICSKEKDVVMIGGVPTWMIVLFRRILEITGKQNMLEVWPNLQAYVHGGVGFSPYRKQFQQFIPSDTFAYQEIYNASEGFFGIQSEPEANDMLLLLDNGTYYEFIPADQWSEENPVAIPLEAVEKGKNYAIVISTNAGLWRYMPGDTVVFTDTNPYKIKITGRTRQFINAFGEEVMVANTDKALAHTCQELNAMATEYTVAPVYFATHTKGGHQWLIEFEKMPSDLEAFKYRLDKNLQKINSDYEAKRFKDLALAPLDICSLPAGTFHQWLKSKKKYGGQNKIPRLSNDRQYVDEILLFLKKQKNTV